MIIPTGGVTLAGAAAGQFEFIGASPGDWVAAPGETLEIDAVFDPTVAGVVAAELLIQTNDATNSLLAIELRGLGHAQFQGGCEPPLAQILDLYQIPVDFVIRNVVPGYILPGDFNTDGVVNIFDYTAWRDNLGAAVPLYTGADSNGDGVVSAADYTPIETAFQEFAEILEGEIQTLGFRQLWVEHYLPCKL